MPIELESLTSEERSDWEHFLKWYGWYQDNGWVGDKAHRLAWADLQRKHQRLQEFSHVT